MCPDPTQVIRRPDKDFTEQEAGLLVLAVPAAAGRGVAEDVRAATASPPRLGPADPPPVGPIAEEAHRAQDSPSRVALSRTSTMRSLGALARRAANSCARGDLFKNAPTRADKRRAEHAIRDDERKRPCSGRKRARHYNRGDDRGERGLDRATQQRGDPTHLTRCMCLMDVPGKGALRPIFVNTAAGLVTGLQMLADALAKTGDSIGCLDLEWGRGTGRRLVPSHRKGMYEWPALLQIGVRDSPALLVDLQRLVPGKRDLDPRLLEWVGASSTASRFGEKAEEALVVSCVRAGYDSVAKVLDYVKTPGGKERKRSGGVKRFGKVSITKVIESGLAAGR